MTPPTSIPFDFWQQAIASLRAIDNHRLLLFAEGKRRNHFTAGFDLEYGMGFYYNLADGIFATHQSVQSIDTFNAREYRNATGHDQVVRYTSNHDVDQSDGSPLTTFNGRQGSLAAFVVAACMKGVPMIYNGQEVGCPIKLSFFDKSTPIDWSLHPGLTKEYQRIIGLRNGSNAIKRGALQSFSSDDVCAFLKSWSAEKIFVVVNLRNARSTFSMPDALRGKRWKDAFTGKDASVPDEFELEPYQYYIYQKVGSHGS